MGSASELSHLPILLIITIRLTEYQRMADALVIVAEKTGTTLIFSLCEWGWVRIIFCFDWFYI